MNDKKDKSAVGEARGKYGIPELVSGKNGTSIVKPTKDELLRCVVAARASTAGEGN